MTFEVDRLEIPINKTAAVVTQRNTDLVPEFNNKGAISSMVPLPTKAYIPNYGIKSWVDLKGVRNGRIVVIGVSLIQLSTTNQKWVVRCDCG